jgi:hypothetical protein
MPGYVQIPLSVLPLVPVVWLLFSRLAAQYLLSTSTESFLSLNVALAIWLKVWLAGSLHDSKVESDPPDGLTRSGSSEVASVAIQDVHEKSESENHASVPLPAEVETTVDQPLSEPTLLDECDLSGPVPACESNQNEVPTFQITNETVHNAVHVTTSTTTKLVETLAAASSPSESASSSFDPSTTSDHDTDNEVTLVIEEIENKFDSSISSDDETEDETTLVVDDIKDEDDTIIRCVCGQDQEEGEGMGTMICCDSCDAWQHNGCMGLSQDYNPDRYFCERCKPAHYRKLFSGMRRVAQPWKEKTKKYNAQPKTLNRVLPLPCNSSDPKLWDFMQMPDGMFQDGRGWIWSDPNAYLASFNERPRHRTWNDWERRDRYGLDAARSAGSRHCR